MKVRKFKLISNPGGMWFEGDEDGDQTPMKIGRIIYDDEILNGELFSYWYVDQEEYFEEVTDMEYNTIIEDQLNDNPVSPEIDRLVDLTMAFFNTIGLENKHWPKEAKKIIRKRGGIELLRIKDLIKIEQILGYQIIKIEKL